MDNVNSEGAIPTLLKCKTKWGLLEHLVVTSLCT